MADVILYTATGCNVSDRARAGLTAEGVDFEERNVMHNKQWYDDVLKQTIFVPMLVRDGKVSIGWKGRAG